MKQNRLRPSQKGSDDIPAWFLRLTAPGYYRILTNLNSGSHVQSFIPDDPDQRKILLPDLTYPKHHDLLNTNNHDIIVKAIDCSNAFYSIRDYAIANPVPLASLDLADTV